MVIQPDISLSTVLTLALTLAICALCMQFMYGVGWVGLFVYIYYLVSHILYNYKVHTHFRDLSIVTFIFCLPIRINNKINVDLQSYIQFCCTSFHAGKLSYRIVPNSNSNSYHHVTSTTVTTNAQGTNESLPIPSHSCLLLCALQIPVWWELS